MGTPCPRSYCKDTLHIITLFNPATLVMICQVLDIKKVNGVFLAFGCWAQVHVGPEQGQLKIGFNALFPLMEKSLWTLIHGLTDITKLLKN